MDKETREFLIRTAITMGILTGVAVVLIGGQKLTFGFSPYYSERVKREMEKLDKKYHLYDTYDEHELRKIKGNTWYERLDCIRSRSMERVNKLEEPFRSIMAQALNSCYAVARDGFPQPPEVVIYPTDENFAYQLSVKKIVPLVMETKRSLARQYWLYTKTNNTRAEPPYSNHIIGLACDIYWYDTINGKLLGSNLLCAFNNELSKIINARIDDRVVWGGKWATIKDCPHFEMNIRRAITKPSEYKDLTNLVSQYERIATDYYNAMSSMGYACKVDSATLKLYDCIHKPGEK